MNAMKLWVARAAVAGAALGLGAEQALGAAETPPSLGRAAEVALSVSVRVVIRPKLAGLDEPILRVVDEERCPNCGRFHSSDLSSLIKKESSVFCVGFALAPDRVVCEDPQLPLENIASVSVSAGGRTVSASVEKRFSEQNALLLKLGEPLAAELAAGVQKEAGRPVCAVRVGYQGRDPRRLQAEPAPLASRVVYGDRSDSWAEVQTPAVLVDEQRRICGFAFNGEWRTNAAADPAQWPAYTPGELAQRAAEAERACLRSVFPVTLSYRSPRMSRNGDSGFERRMMRGRSGESSETETELNTVGALLSGRRLFVRIGQDKEKLVRLERIKVFLPEGPVEASFVCALASVRGIVAELPQPRPDRVLRVADESGLSPKRLTFLAQVDVAGPGRLRVRTAELRVRAVTAGWRDQLTTELPISEKENVFLFSEDGTCLWWSAAVVVGEDSIGEGDRSWRDGSDYQLLPAFYLAALAQPEARDIDAAVRPASPENENRLGWLGVDLQPITRELAESKKILAETGGGAYGALVTRVYADSPAARAGVKEGWVLLSLGEANRALPQKVKLEEMDSPYRSEFPWDRLDEVPAEYMDRLPTPWPSVNNSFVAGLTRMGVGTKVTAAFLADGVKAEKSLAIALAPASFETAPSFKWKAAGISVCDLTYEVRDYLGLPPDAPGVVVCRVEGGGKAVTAGVRPFEVVTQVNDKPVTSAKEFEKLVGGVAEVRLNVKRMTRDRVVAFTLPPAK